MPRSVANDGVPPGIEAVVLPAEVGEASLPAKPDPGERTQSIVEGGSDKTHGGEIRVLEQ